MKIKFEKAIMINALAPAMGAVSTGNTITATEGILFKAKNESLTIFAYDLEKGMRTNVEAEIKEEGECIINAQKLYQIIRVMPEGEVEIYVDNSLKTIISGGTSCFELRALEADTFPALPELSGERGFTIPQHVTKAFITKTAFAISPNDNRAAFRGALFEIKGNKITVVTCDGNRLAKCERICEVDLENKNVDGSELDISFIIPGKTLGEFSKIISDNEDSMTIELARKHVIMRVGEITYFSRLIDTEFIDYNRIIPTNSNITVYVNSVEFRHALERASLVTEDKTVGSVRPSVRLTVNDGILKISSTSASGSVSDTINIDQKGDSLEIGFNCRFLLEALKVCGSGELKILLSTPMMGISIMPSDRINTDSSDKSSNDYFFFIMPVRLNN